MKTIGKIAALAMTLSLAFVLTACGGNASSSAAASNASASASAASASASAASTSASAASTSASAAAASTSAAAASSSAVEQADTYTNEYFELQYRLPEGWSFIDVSAVNSIGGPISAAAQGVKLDMVAAPAEMNKLVVVSVVSADASNAGQTAEQFLEARQKEIEANLQGNYTFSSSSATVTFDGIDRELPASVTDLTIDGVSFSLCQAVAEKDGNFLNVITLGANQAEATDLLKDFSAKSA